MLSGVGSPVWYYMVLSWLDLVYVLFPFIHFARSLIISVNRRHFNDLCFVFGFSAFFPFCLFSIIFGEFLVLVFGLLCAIYMLNCDCRSIYSISIPAIPPPAPIHALISSSYGNGITIKH